MAGLESGSPGGGNPENKNEGDKPEALLQQQGQEYSAGRARNETLRIAENPSAVIMAVRSLLECYEDERKRNINPTWLIDESAKILEDREYALRLTLEELVQGGYAAEIREDGTGEAIIPGYALGTRVVERVVPDPPRRIIKVEEFEEVDGSLVTKKDRSGNPKVTVRVESVTLEEKKRVVERVPFYGTNAGRTEMSKTCGDAHKEIVIRKRVDNLFSQLMQTAPVFGQETKLFYMAVTDVVYSGEFEDLYKLEETPGAKDPESSRGVTDEGERAEKRKFGTKIHLAQMAVQVMTACEDIPKIKALKYVNGKDATEGINPGWRDLFPNKDVEEEWVGDINTWIDRVERDASGRPKKDSEGKVIINGELDEKLKDEKRGKLTLKNIAATRETQKEWDDFNRALAEFVGGDVGAARLGFHAAYLFGDMGQAAGQRFSYDEDEEKYKAKLVVEGFPSTEGLSEAFFPELYREKYLGDSPEKVQGAVGPRATKGKINEIWEWLGLEGESTLTTGFLEYCQVSTKELGGSPPYGKRSFKELLWKGYNGKLYRSGDLPWDGLRKERWRDKKLQEYFIGDENRLWEIMKGENIDPIALTGHEWWSKFRQAIGLVFNTPVVFRGQNEMYFRMAKTAAGQEKMKKVIEKCDEGKKDDKKVLPKVEKEKGDPEVYALKLSEAYGEAAVTLLGNAVGRLILDGLWTSGTYRTALAKVSNVPYYDFDKKMQTAKPSVRERIDIMAELYGFGDDARLYEPLKYPY